MLLLFIGLDIIYVYHLDLLLGVLLLEEHNLGRLESQHG